MFCHVLNWNLLLYTKFANNVYVYEQVDIIYLEYVFYTNMKLHYVYTTNEFYIYVYYTYMYSFCLTSL